MIIKKTKLRVNKKISHMFTGKCDTMNIVNHRGRKARVASQKGYHCGFWIAECGLQKDPQRTQRGQESEIKCLK
jgi:ribosomal protein L23